MARRLAVVLAAAGTSADSPSGPESLLTWHFNASSRPETLLPRRAILDLRRKARHVRGPHGAVVSQYRRQLGTKWMTAPQAEAAGRQEGLDVYSGETL